MITTILFDLDDTIVTGKIYEIIYPKILAMFKEHGIDAEKRAKEEGLELNPYGRYDSGDLCREWGYLKEYYQIIEPEIHTITSIKENVKEVLEQLKGKKLGIVSNTMLKTIQIYLKKYELEHYFEFIFSFEDSEHIKSSKGCWQDLIDKENLNPNECLVVGDNPVQDGEIPASLGFNTLIIKDDEDLKPVLKFI